ncbi:hypothetical protein ACG7TL_000992 [Trametes sanguinea]
MAPSPASFPKLSNRNYQQWRLDMEARLRTLGAMRIVQGTESRPHFTEPLDSGERRELRDYDSRVDTAAREIWNCVEREQQTHLEAIRDDPGAMWTKLESVHMQKRPGTHFNTYNTLLSLSKADDESLSTLSTRASQLKSDMKALRPADFDLSKLDDELVLMALIRALPAEYNALRQTLLLDDSLTLEKLQDTFVALENQPGAPSSTPALSHAVSTLSCTFCGRSGHSEDQCFAKCDASTKAKEKAAQRTQYQRSGKAKRKETASEASKDAKDASDTAQESAGAATVSAGCASALLSTSDRASWLSSPVATNWNTDTGASAHMTPHRHWFRSYLLHVIPIRLTNSHIVYSAGLGSVVFQPAEREGVVPPAVVLHDVLHVPALASNLLSVFHLTREKGYTVELCASQVLFYHQGQLRFEASVNEHNVGYLLGRTVSQAKHALSASSTCEEDESLWHQRCSHVNLDDLRSVVKKGLVSGLVLRSKRKPDPICEPCLAGKLNRHSIPRLASRKHTPIALVHTDLKGPLPVPTPKGHVYWMTFVCDATRFWVVAYLKRKSDTFAAFQAYKVYAENCLGLRIKATHDDKGGKYIGREYNDFCAQHGIQHQHTEPDEPHQNGVAERANRMIAEGATALLAQSKLPLLFWGHAASTFVHTRNHIPTSALGGAIPYTAWKGKGRKPDVSYFRTFGCLAYVLVRKKDRKALEPHSRKCIFVGYPESTKAWRFWDPAARRFIISLHAVFDERCFPGNSPSINVFGLPLDEVDIPGDPAMADKPPEDVPDAPELPDQGGDDWDDPAPPAPPAPPPASPAPPAAPAGQRKHSPAAPERTPSPPAPPAPAPVVPQPPAAPAPAPVPPHPPVRPSVHQQAEGHGGFRPYPALARKHLPARSTRFQGSLNNQELERRNLMPQRLRIGTPSPAATPEPSERGDTPQRHSSSPDPLIDAPVEPEPAPAPASAPAPPAPPPSPASSDDKLDLLAEGHEDVYECSLEAMLSGIEDVYCAQGDDYLTYDNALAFASESVAEHACGSTSLKDSIQRIKDELGVHFKLWDLGPTSWLLGVKIERDRAKRSLSISQRQYALNILKRYGFANCDPVGTPMDPGLRLSADMGPSTPSAAREMQDVPYGQDVGSLFYLAVATRPDIARTVGNLARFSKNPGMTHWKAVKHLFRYIKGTLDYKLTPPAPPTSSPPRTPTQIMPAAQTQSIVALSTTEAEFVAAVSAGQEVLWLRNLLTEFGFDVSAASRLRIDNLSALSVAKNPEHHGRMKHLDLHFYWLQDEVDKGRIEIEHLCTSDMPADILTKSLAKPKVLEMVKMLGLGT